MYTHKCGISEYNQTKNLQFIRKIFAIIIFLFTFAADIVVKYQRLYGQKKLNSIYSIHCFIY